MRTFNCITPAEAQALVAHVRCAMDRKRAIWSVVCQADSTVVQVSGFNPVIEDVARASGVRVR